MNIMNVYQRTIYVFTHRIDELQSYLENMIEKIIEEEMEGESEKLLIPFVLAADANLEEGDKGKLPKKEISDLENSFGRKIEFEEEAKEEVEEEPEEEKFNAKRSFYLRSTSHSRINWTILPYKVLKNFFF